MGIKVVLFDLDGTLLPMDQDVFVKTYFKGIAAKLAPYGYEPKALIDIPSKMEINQNYAEVYRNGEEGADWKVPLKRNVGENVGNAVGKTLGCIISIIIVMAFIGLLIGLGSQ